MSKSTLYLDLIVENLNGQRMYSGKDEHSDQIYKYNNIREKLDSVINKSIFLLRKGAFTEVDLRLPEKILTDLPMNTGHYRTICLLVSFKYFLNNQNNNTISNILNGVHDISLNTNNLYVSIPLLLLQSIRLSQIEWDSNRYCYEYFSSKIATSHLSTTLDQIQKADKESKDIVKMIFEQVIRWHTLLGQCNRGTASFCIPDQWQDLQGLLNSFYPDKHSIINRNQNYLMIIPVLLKIFEVLDNILRIENSK